MLRYSIALIAGMLISGPTFAASWTDSVFSEINKDFGSVPRGPILKHNFMIKNTTGSPIRAIQLRVSCGCTVARMDDPVIAPGATGVITADMDSGRFLGDRTVYIYVLFDQPSLTEVTLSVHARSHEDIVISPDMIDFGRGPKGVRKFQTTVTIPFGQQWQIQNVVSDTSHVTATIAPAPPEQGPNRFVVNAVLDDQLPAGNWHTEIWLNTNHPFMPKIRIPVKAVVEPSLIVSPSMTALTVAADAVPVTRKVLVRGPNPFTITSIKGAEGNWKVVEDNPGKSGTHILTVTVTGPVEGSSEKTFEITTDLPGDNKVTFQVKAEGTK